MNIKTNAKLYVNILTIGLLIIGSITFGNYSEAKIKKQTNTATQPMPNLNGEKAKEYLKEQGLYRTLREAMFSETEKLTASDADLSDAFGFSVSISGNTAIVGAYFDDGATFNTGAAYIFERNAGGANMWNEVRKITASDANADSNGGIGFQFGISVSISGDTAIVGANGTDGALPNIGSAYIFERNAGGANNWGEVRKHNGRAAGGGNQFGFSVSISGNTAIVGAPEYFNETRNTRLGSAYIFERNAGGANNWGEVRQLNASDIDANDEFGFSVSISDNTAIVGNFRNDDAGQDSGSAYIFERNTGGANNWGEVVKLTASDAAATDYFGFSVSISGDTAIVGAFLNDNNAGTNSGSAYIFERNAGGANNWGEVRQLNASDAAAFDSFGISVSISGDTAIVGAVGNDDAGTTSGSTYIFKRNMSGANMWGEGQKITASDAAREDQFGRAVGISGDTVIVGTPYDDDAGESSGSAYIFENSSTPRNNRPRFDFDGDGKTDISVFRPISTGSSEWYYLRSSDGVDRGFPFGLSSDRITPADFTGDGKTDIAFWRPSTGFWFVLRSEDNSFFAFPFGTNGDIPAPGDFDGDGKADAAVFRPSIATWFIRNSSDGSVTTRQFGANGDVPIVEDYDGDGKDDIAVYRPSVSEWYLNRSTAGFIGFRFGAPGDATPVPADFTGDGKADIAFFAKSTNQWFVLRSEDTSFFAFPFGASGDIPAPGDYDGDGRADAAVFRPSSGTWYLNRSTSGAAIIGFGAGGDKPLPAAFVPQP